MQKQHQLLAYLSEVQGKHNAIRLESKKVLNNQANFTEFSRVYTPFDENDKDIPQVESKSMVTTATNRLKYDDKFFKAYINSLGEKELTNQVANADIVVIDEDTGEKAIVCEKVPVTLLLELEKVIKQQLEFYKSIPTVDMNVTWRQGINNSGDSCFETDKETKVRKVNKKKLTTFNQNPEGVKDKFPLVQQMVAEETPVGQYVTTTKSGAMMPNEKAMLCENCEQLLKAVKSARAKANEAETIACNYGKEILDFINK